LTDAPFRVRYLPDGGLVTAQATTLIELLGNGVLSNLAELGFEDGKVPVGNAAGEYELKDQSNLGIQDPNGSLRKLAALTLAASKILLVMQPKCIICLEVHGAGAGRGQREVS